MANKWGNKLAPNDKDLPAALKAKPGFRAGPQASIPNLNDSRPTPAVRSAGKRVRTGKAVRDSG